MASSLRLLAPPGPCSYLPHETSQLEYEFFTKLSPLQYRQRMQEGWRRFGFAVFRPQCSACQACQPIRVVVPEFQPNRSQRRVRRLNDDVVRLVIGKPAVTREKLSLYDRYHAFQTEAKDWPLHPPKDVASYQESFVDNPFPTEEWCYYLDEKLIGVGYVDVVPEALSAIYFFYDPDCRERGLGVWNVLSVIDEAARRGLPHVYLGYYVAGCGSMEYKATFRPNEVRGVDGVWQTFRR